MSPGFSEPSARMAIAPSGWSMAACRAEGVHNFKAPEGPAPLTSRLTIDCDDGELMAEYFLYASLADAVSVTIQLCIQLVLSSV